ncbi:MAG: phosphoribosylamine--glycine ligase [Bacteroidetes bacterium]|jgi:phosphoribosylamine--glycine ligase|nr:phosphoribosylamine--glycine ligase [Bacteroidota bacterium]
MKMLVIGSGGREHAMVKALQRSPLVTKVWCAPGNAGIAQDAECVPIRADDLNGLLRFVREQSVTLTVVGPEQPLVLGIVDLFRVQGLAIFGPTRSAALLEGSKAFAKAFMARYGIPTAKFGSFGKNDAMAAESFIRSMQPPMVVKADGLAAGKGVVICQTRDDALEAVRSMLSGEAFGAAGERVVVEEFLTGEELSVFVVTDGERSVMLAPAQDHKRIFDNDRGKNTGGMGAYAPAPLGTPELLERVQREVVEPTLRGMRSEGSSYTGCLYVGLMVTPNGPSVLEYNCRFGDPETQVVLPLIASDVAELFVRASSGQLQPEEVRLAKATAVCVVMASGGYPDHHETGKEIMGLQFLDGREDVVAYHAGTKVTDGKVVTAGGRVLGITAVGGADDLAGTIRAAYEAVRKVKFEGAHYRGDIGSKGVR